MSRRSERVRWHSAWNSSDCNNPTGGRDAREIEFTLLWWFNPYNIENIVKCFLLLSDHYRTISRFFSIPLDLFALWYTQYFTLCHQLFYWYLKNRLAVGRNRLHCAGTLLTLGRCTRVQNSNDFNDRYPLECLRNDSNFNFTFFTY